MHRGATATSLEESVPPGVTIRWSDRNSVVVDGTVHTFAAHVAALRAARRLPGVHHVHDRLAIRLDGVFHATV